ncbi:hypothetical protein BDL97_08G145400 [Sphagnum fallax]|nr:hypothetical protein BDL97_08G145400 [Sphagnum fallax]KAH8955560.1 hypothetical protein BDL97_08G145400 [Sphagnum fallax]
MSPEVKRVKIRSQKGKDEESSSSPETISNQATQRVSLPRRVMQESVAPILAVKAANGGGGGKDVSSQFLMFLVKLAALEMVRRSSMAICRPIWWGLQALSLIQAPPFNWLQRWTQIHILAQATQSFSMPMVVLSLATAVTSVYKEIQQPDTSGQNLSSLRQRHHYSRDTVEIEPKEEEIIVADEQADSLHLLKRELESKGILIPERIHDDELERFWIAANGNVSKFISSVKKTVRWRESYHFLLQPDLKEWIHLVFWHGYDAQRHPTLIIRLGLAYSILVASDRSRFSQAVVSQVEHGVLHMLSEEDARLTVVIDCEGTTAFGFPVQMMKTCIVLVQENYPTRLASLFVINLSPVMHMVANTIMQVLKPSTREKVHVEGKRYRERLTSCLGGEERVPFYLGGKCKCSLCAELKSQSKQDMSLVVHRAQSESEQLEDDDMAIEESAYGERLSIYRSYSFTLRVIIVGLLMLWIVVAMVAGFYEPQLTPT